MAAIEACTGATCEVNAGKPGPLMLEAAMELLGLEAGGCVLVGDRLATDIAMAVAAGMPSAVVLTGDTTPELLAAAPPGSGRTGSSTGSTGCCRRRRGRGEHGWQTLPVTAGRALGVA